MASFKDIKVQDTGFEILHWVLVGFRKERVHNRLTFTMCKGMGFPGGSAGKESACNAGDLGFDPLERERLPTPVFWPGEFHGLYSPWGRKESDTTERLGEEEGMVLGTRCVVISFNP